MMTSFCPLVFPGLQITIVLPGNELSLLLSLQIFARSALNVHLIKNITWSKSVCPWVCESVSHAFLNKNHALKVN